MPHIVNAFLRFMDWAIELPSPFWILALLPLALPIAAAVVLLAAVLS